MGGLTQGTRCPGPPGLRARTVGAQQLELTFPGELAGLSAADQSSLKADIKAAVAKASAAITEADIADVSLRAGSIVATVTFKPAVSAAAAQQAATTIAAAPVQISVGTTTLRSTAAQAKQNAAPDQGQSLGCQMRGVRE